MATSGSTGVFVSRGRKLAGNAVVQVAGEIGSRLVGLGFYAVLARQLGLRGFGVFTFALALVGLIALADSAIDDVLARDVAAGGSDPARIGDAIVAKVVVGAGVGALVIAFTLVGDYSWRVEAVVSLMVLGALPELALTTFFAVRRGLGDFRTGTVGLLAIRTARAATAIALMVAGGKVLAATGVYAATGILAAGLVLAALWARGGLARVTFARGGLRRVLSRSWRLAVAGAVDTAIVSLPAIALSLAAGADAVGAFGAGIRLALLTQFVSAALATAALPLLAERERSQPAGHRELVESTLKAAVAVAAPVAVFLAWFAAPLIDAFYGHGYGAAVTPTRVLAAIVVLRAVGSVTFVAMLARDRLSALLRIPVAAVAVQAALLAVLVPAFGASGAAIAAVSAELVYTGLLLAATTRLLGHVSAIRVAAGSVAAAVAMSFAVLLFGTDIDGMAAGLAAYGTTLLAWERLAYPADIRLIRALVKLPNGRKWGGEDRIDPSYLPSTG